MIGISACLLGAPVRYDGSDKLFEPLKILIQHQKAVSICPEILAGFPMPRPSAEIIGGDGRDVTDLFKEGALKALAILQTKEITHVILKANSPSCSSQQIYQGKFDGSLHKGIGVATSLFIEHGITVWDEESDKLIPFLQQLCKD